MEGRDILAPSLFPLYTGDMSKDRRAYHQAYYQANKEKYDTRSKAWRIANPEKMLEFDRKWKAKNQDKIAAYELATRDKRLARQCIYDASRRDKEKHKECVRKWRSKHGKEYHVRWRNENRGKTRATSAKRRARKLNATPIWADLKAIQSIYERASEQGLTVDHIIPLQGENVCGLHVPLNLQLLTQ